MVKTKKINLSGRLQSIFVVLAVCFIIGIIPQVSAITWDNTGYWKFDETTGVVVDELGDNNGINNGADRGETGLIGNSFYYDGTDDVTFDDAGLPTGANANFSVCMWFNDTNADEDDNIFYQRNLTGGNNRFYIKVHGDRDTSSVYFGGISSSEVSYTSNEWNFICVMRNSGNVSLWMNGVYQTSYATTVSVDDTPFTIGEPQYDGFIDELSIWDRSLTPTEISDLYNSGDGTTLPITSTIITLESPQNESIISGSEINFTISGSNISALSANWTNVTYNIWNSTSLFDSTIVDFTDNETFNQTSLISGFTFGNYEWNANACYENVTGTYCIESENNNSFDWRPFEIVSQDYNAFVYETDRQRFNLSITTIESVLSVSSKLNYNGTQYSAETSCTAETCNIYSIIDIPLVSTGESINRTYYWNITVYDGTNSYSFDTETESNEQNITRIHLEKCAGIYTTNTVNFTSYYETNLTRINPFFITGTFDTWLGSGLIYRTQSFDESSTADLKLCITPTGRTQYSNAQIEYKFEDENITFIPRNYFFQNKTLTNVSEEINLLLLEAEDSTSFIIKVQDQKLSPVTEALVYIQKYYPADGTFRTVQIAKTDSNGETLGFYETETVDYRHIIIKNGVILLQTAQQKVVGKSVPYTLTFTIGTALGYPWTSFEDSENVTTTLDFDKDTNIVTFSYIENTTGYVSSAQLLVYQNSLTNSTAVVICNVTSSEASATLICDLSSYNGTFTAMAYINGGSEKIIEIIITDAREIFGNDGLFLGMMIILTAGFAMMWNPAAGIISINAAVIFVNIIGFISVSPIFIFGMISISVITIILLKT